MYIFGYAVSDEDANEMYAEYHLGRRSFRACKKGTKFCGWHREMPNFYQWRHLCESLIPCITKKALPLPCSNKLMKQNFLELLLLQFQNILETPLKLL